MVPETLSREPLAWLKARARVVEAESGSPEFAAAMSVAQGLAVRTYTRVDRGLLDALPKLRVVGRAGVGLDNIDLEACAHRRIQVVHTPDANTQAVVEYVTSLLCWSYRSVEFLDGPLELPAWEAVRSTHVAPRQMDELTLGVLGVGRVGTRFAAVARAIGLRVLCNDIDEAARARAPGAEWVSADQLFRDSDAITLHIDGRPSNHGVVNRDLLSVMRSDALFINTSRGMVVDHESLARHLRANPRSRAILDVHDPEPFTATNPLLGLPNAHLAAHLASRTRTAMTNMSWVVRDLIAVLEGRTPEFPASPR